MALSNLTKEPRRELIETGFGLAGITLFLGSDYYLARVLQLLTFNMNDSGGIPIFIGMLFTPILLLAVAGFTYIIIHLIHNIGEDICAALAKRGHDPRPKTRYN